MNIEVKWLSYFVSFIKISMKVFTLRIMRRKELMENGIDSAMLSSGILKVDDDKMKAGGDDDDECKHFF